MATKPAVKLADPHADRARPGKLALIAIVATGLGFAIAVGSAGPPPSAHVKEDAGQRLDLATAAAGELLRILPRPAASPPQSADHPPRAAALPPGASIESERELSVDRSSIAAEHTLQELDPSARPSVASLTARAAAVSKPAVGTAGTGQQPSPKRAFEPGVVAYVRCDGLERARRRYPCPRDRKLEEHVWRALSGLTECSVADPGQGRAEVRLTLQPATDLRIELRPPAEGPSLDLDAISKCAGARLAQARSHLRTPLAVVSFRFQLQ